MHVALCSAPVAELLTGGAAAPVVTAACARPGTNDNAPTAVTCAQCFGLEPGCDARRPIIGEFSARDARTGREVAPRKSDRCA